MIPSAGSTGKRCLYEIAYAATPSFQTQSFSQPLTTTAFDILSRATNVTAPNGSLVTTGYGDLVVTQTDPRDQTTITRVDVWGRTVSVTPPEGPGLSYTYDTLNRLKTVTKGSGGTPTEIFYDQLGRKINMNDPDMGTWSYDYDALGKLTLQTDARGCTITMGYDALNRLDTKTFTGPGACATTPGVTYTYDVGINGLGQRTGMSDGSGNTAWEYDERGRLVKETKFIDPETFVTQWTYNSSDQPVTMTYPVDGEVVTYTYNNQGTLASMADLVNNFTYLDSVKYDEAGRITQLDLGSNLLRRSYDYFPWSTSTQGGMLQSLTSTQLSGALDTLQSFGYTYDANGNVLQITDGVANETSGFTYDTINRLETMTVTDTLSQVVHSEVFNYNAATGNLASKGPDQANLTAYQYDGLQPHAATAFGDNTNGDRNAGCLRPGQRQAG